MNGDHWKQNGGCEVRLMNPKMGQRRASLAVEKKKTLVNGQGQIVQSGNYSHSSFRAALIDEKTKEHSTKDYYNYTSNRIVLYSDKQGVRCVKAGDLVPVFEKSNTEPKQMHKAKLLKCKSIVNVAVFNVRISNTVYQLPDLTTSAA